MKSNRTYITSFQIALFKGYSNEIALLRITDKILSTLNINTLTGNPT